MIIRKPRQEDIPELGVLFQLTRQHAFVSRSKEEFQIGDYTQSTVDEEVWVAEEDGIIVGFVSIYLPSNFVHSLYVHPDYQGRGIGMQLLQIAEGNLGRPMTLKIAMDNEKACSFYEKYGWCQLSVHEDAEEPYWLYGKD